MNYDRTPGPWTVFDNDGLTLKRRISVNIGNGPNRYRIEFKKLEDAHAVAAVPEMIELIGRISCMSEYGDGPDQLGDNEDAALCLNALITQATAIYRKAKGPFA